jgi:hypothetical protein
VVVLKGNLGFFHGIMRELMVCANGLSLDMVLTLVLGVCTSWSGFDPSFRTVLILEWFSPIV